VSLGAFVTAGVPLVRLTQTDPLRLTFTLPERDASKLVPGQKIVGIAGDCTARFETTVGIIDPSVEPTTRAIRAQATVPNPDRRLRAGMSARLSVEVGRREAALTVPHEAVVRRGTQEILYVVADDGAIEERKVDLGQHFPKSVEVRSGISAGESIVVAGQQKIRPGSVADPKPYEPVENPKLALGLPTLSACDL
jgi:membrane fusion protein (multidrug efflux system)